MTKDVPEDVREDDGKLRRPCANCPWRIDAPRGHWDPQHFRDIWRNCQDDGLSQMQCHKSTLTVPLPCQGWARVVGYDAIGVRLAVMRGMLRRAEVADRDGPPLFSSFAAMLRANRVPHPSRNRFTRRLRRAPGKSR